MFHSTFFLVVCLSEAKWNVINVVIFQCLPTSKHWSSNAITACHIFLSAMQSVSSTMTQLSFESSTSIGLSCKKLSNLNIFNLFFKVSKLESSFTLENTYIYIYIYIPIFNFCWCIVRNTFYKIRLAWTRWPDNHQNITLMTCIWNKLNSWIIVIFLKF